MAYRKTAFQIFVSGRKGQGKTTLTDGIARGRDRVFCFDLLGEYRAKGFTLVHSMVELRAAVRKRWHKGWKIAFLPARPNAELKITYAGQLSDMCETICAIQQPYYDTPDGKHPPIPKVLFLIEEMRWSYPNGCNLPGMPTLTTLGRHYGVDMIGTTQRVAEVSTNYKGNADVQYFFAQDAAADIETIGRMIGREHIAALKALKPHHYLRLYQGQVILGRNPVR